MQESIRSTIDGGLARLTLCRPPLNVLTSAMLRELAGAVESAAADEGVRLIRLDAEGKAFSAGVDVADHVGDKVGPMMEALDRVFETLDRVAVPTVAVVQGAALGGGCELALATDLCVASEAARFGQPEIRLGVFAPPASVILPRLVGERRALGLLLSGDTIPAAEAERIGVVNAVLPPDGFEEAAAAWVARLLRLSGSGLRFAKRAVRESRRGTRAEALRVLHRIYVEELMRTEDAQEGLRAFMDKREPAWRHR